MLANLTKKITHIFQSWKIFNNIALYVPVFTQPSLFIAKITHKKVEEEFCNVTTEDKNPGNPFHLHPGCLTVKSHCRCLFFF